MTLNKIKSPTLPENETISLIVDESINGQSKKDLLEIMYVQSIDC